MINKILGKKGQEEMIGFALIVILVAVIFLVFLGLSLKNQEKEAVKSYEVDSFIQAFLQYHTGCKDESGNMSIQDLIFSCNRQEACTNNVDGCGVLNSTLEEIVEKSWEVGEETPVKGYELKILANSIEILNLQKGDITENYKGSVQDFVKKGDSIQVFFTAYY